MLLNPRAEFPLAVRLREPGGAEIGEVFSFLSKLYFRGKLTYAREFAMASGGAPPIHIITTDRGLVTPETRVQRSDRGTKAFSTMTRGGRRRRRA